MPKQKKTEKKSEKEHEKMHIIINFFILINFFKLKIEIGEMVVFGSLTCEPLCCGIL